MELGEGITVIKGFLNDGNHKASDSKEILNYMITYLHFTCNNEDLELDRDRIEHAYKSGIMFVKLTKGVKVKGF